MDSYGISLQLVHKSRTQLEKIRACLALAQPANKKTELIIVRKIQLQRASCPQSHFYQTAQLTKRNTELSQGKKPQ